MRPFLKFAGIVLLCGWAVLTWTPGGRAGNDSSLPAGPNRELVETTCTPCHSAALILQNRMKRDRWDETITWMQEKQGLETLTPATRNQILDYLETVRGLASSQKRERPGRNPMYDYDYPPNPL